MGRTVNVEDFAVTFGAGGGVTIHLASSQRTAFSLDIGARYLYGGEVEYLPKGTLRPESVIEDLALRSRTDVLTLHVGISFDFAIQSSTP